MSQITFTTAGCDCLNCKTHRSKTNNCQCFNCISHKKKDDINNTPIDGVNSSYKNTNYPSNTEIVVDKVEKNNSTVYWIIFFVIIFIIFLVIIGCCCVGRGYNSYTDGYYNKEVITETNGPNGTKTYYIYKNSNEGGSLGWLIFWLFIIFLVFSPTYYYTRN